MNLDDLDTTDQVILFIVVWLIVLWGMNILLAILRYTRQRFFSFLRLVISGALAAVLVGLWSPPTSAFSQVAVFMLSVVMFGLWLIGSSIIIVVYGITKLCHNRDCTILKEGARVAFSTLVGYYWSSAGKKQPAKEDDAKGNPERITQLEDRMQNMLDYRVIQESEILGLRSQVQLLERLLKLNKPR